LQSKPSIISLLQNINPYTSVEDIIKIINTTISHEKRLKDISSYMSKKKMGYKILYLNIATTSLKIEEKNFVIYPNGLKNSKRFNSQDGIVIFGSESEYNNYCDFIFPVNNNNNSKYDQNNEKISNNNQIDNFFSFLIFFCLDDENFYLKNFNKNLGCLMKIQKYEINQNTLLNIGNTFLIINIDKIEKILKIKIFNNETIKKIENEVLDIKANEMSFDLKQKNIVTIGRNNSCDVVLEDMMLSKIQCSIILEEDKNKNKKIIMLYDGNYKKKKESTNGTWVYIMENQVIYNNFEFKVNHTLFVATLK
jgi:hypothetical protein